MINDRAADDLARAALAAGTEVEVERGYDAATAMREASRCLDCGVTPVFDYFVVATGSSRRQIHAMADEIEKVMKRQWHDLKRGSEGYEEGRWIVLDYGSVIVHIFTPPERDFYKLEQLWSDAKVLVRIQ